jgi:hypothetical protein
MNDQKATMETASAAAKAQTFPAPQASSQLSNENGTLFPAQEIDGWVLGADQ